MSISDKKVFLVDGNSQAYQAYYAIKSGLSAPDGSPTNAVYGFTSMLQKILREKKPDYIAVAFDTAAPTFRHKAFTDYKANRKPMPDDLVPQLDVIRQVLDAYRIPVFSVDGYEADDVLGTLAFAVAREGLTAVIVTRDKDALQLLGPRVMVWDNKKDSYLTVDTLKEEMQIAPSQVVEMMALSGDATDNVPGVPGIGPKTALTLIQRFGSLDNVLAHVGEVPGEKTRENIRAHEAAARQSKDLVTIDTSVPLDLDFDALKLSAPDKAALADIFRRLDFRSMLSALAETATDSGAKYILVNDDASLARLTAELSRASSFAVDTETTGVSPIDSDLVGISFATKEGQGWYVPIRCPVGEKCLAPSAALAALKPFLEDAGKAKIGQNLKFDTSVLRRAGIAVRGIRFDTMLAAYLIDPGRRRYALDDLAADYLNVRMTPISDLIGSGKKEITLDLVESARVADYSGADADISLRLANRLGPDLERLALDRLFFDLEMPLVEVLSRMESTGVMLDAAYLKSMSGDFQIELSALEKKIHAAVGHEFNIASTQQLAGVLFNERGLRPGRRTKTGLSTDNDVLERLAEEDELAALVLEYRSLAKLKSTYLDALPEMISPRTGRVHCSFNQTGTATGRLSSSDPNLQNIPIRTELGSRIRRAFITEPGFSLVAADYSQIELRFVAHLSGDRALTDAFQHGRDIHNFVAREIYGVADKDVTSEMRRMAKAVNFGIIYGQSPYGLSKQLGISVSEAAAFIDQYFARYKSVEDFIQSTLEAAKANGYVTTILGRRRYLSGIDAQSPRNLNASERMAVNSAIQGSAADLIKLAMLRIDRRLRESNSPARMLIQIHDELVFEMPSPLVEEESKRIAADMTGALKLSVPIVVNVASGPNWLEAGG
jgi:DNA polymerase-1